MDRSAIWGEINSIHNVKIPMAKSHKVSERLASIEEHLHMALELDEALSSEITLLG